MLASGCGLIVFVGGDGTARDVWVLLMKSDKVPFAQLVTIGGTDATVPVSQIDDPVYNNPP